MIEQSVAERVALVDVVVYAAVEPAVGALAVAVIYEIRMENIQTAVMRNFVK